MKAPPYLQTRPDHAPRPFPHPHRAPWRRVSGARGRANLRAAKLHLACGASVTHDLAAQLPTCSCSRRERPAPAHPTELRPNARARAAAHAKDTSCDGSRSCASAAATRQLAPFRLQSLPDGVRSTMKTDIWTIWAPSGVRRKIPISDPPHYTLARMTVRGISRSCQMYGNSHCT